MSYDAKKEWTQEYLNQSQMAFPAEYLIKIFRGSYPRLNLDKQSFVDKKLCEVGIGDGRNVALYNKCGFIVHGVEITQEIIDKTIQNLKQHDLQAELKVGSNSEIPYPNCYFDYLVSWNACYYVGSQMNFESNVREYARVLKDDGYLILSIPTKNCYLYQGSETIKNGFQLIKNDVFNIRNGEILRMFQNESDIEDAFSKYFENFTFGYIGDDCFGLENHWHLAVARKKH